MNNKRVDKRNKHRIRTEKKIIEIGTKTKQKKNSWNGYENGLSSLALLSPTHTPYRTHTHTRTCTSHYLVFVEVNAAWSADRRYIKYADNFYLNSKNNNKNKTRIRIKLKWYHRHRSMICIVQSTEKKKGQTYQSSSFYTIETHKHENQNTSHIHAIRCQNVLHYFRYGISFVVSSSVVNWWYLFKCVFVYVCVFAFQFSFCLFHSTRFNFLPCRTNSKTVWNAVVHASAKCDI